MMGTQQPPQAYPQQPPYMPEPQLKPVNSNQLTAEPPKSQRQPSALSEAQKELQPKKKKTEQPKANRKKKTDDSKQKKSASQVDKDEESGEND